MALGARIFGGLVNPNIGVISACVGELVKKKEHQGMSHLTRTDVAPADAGINSGKGFSVVPFLRGLGFVFSSLNDAHKANSRFQKSDWSRDWRPSG
jgi:hypothetical protein